MPRTTAHDVILEILRCSDGEWIGKARLHKVFYFAHLYYANEKSTALTEWPIVRKVNGPGIDRIDQLLQELKDLVSVESVHVGPFPEYRYRLMERGASQRRPGDDACLAIKEAVFEFMQINQLRVSQNVDCDNGGAGRTEGC